MDFWGIFAEPLHWLESTKTLIWWRNQVVAPLSEEWTFRACMLPLLLQCFTPPTAIFMCSSFFGLAHFHHIVERTKMGMNLKHAIVISCKRNRKILNDENRTKLQYENNWYYSNKLIFKIFKFIQINSQLISKNFNIIE